MRYITIPEDVEICHPITREALIMPGPDGQPTKEVFSFARSCRTAIFVVSQKNGADALQLCDLRTKLEEARVGDVLQLSDVEWGLLEPEFKRPTPQGFGPCWALGGGELHIRAWLEAPSKRPQRPLNGAAVIELATPAAPEPARA